MGLLSAIALLPLAPVRGVIRVAERLGEAADRELHEPGVIRARLAGLNRALEDGEISEEQFELEEERLLTLQEGRVLALQEGRVLAAAPTASAGAPSPALPAAGSTVPGEANTAFDRAVAG